MSTPSEALSSESEPDPGLALSDRSLQNTL
jgi:hypothetical protein